MRISSSFLALLALIPTIASTTPVAQRIEENVSSPEPASISQPKATPKRDCIIRPISHSLDGDFALYASLDTSPFLYNVLSRGNTAEKVIELYITLARPFPPLFTLTNGLLNTTVGSDNAPVSGRFGPSSNGLQRLLFGGSGEPADFYSVRNCYDAEGNPNDELVAGREFVVETLEPGQSSLGDGTIFAKNPEEDYPGNYTSIYLRIGNRGV